MALKQQAATATAKQVLELQHAREPLEILCKAHAHRAAYQASHLSQALLRVGKGVLWDAAARERVLADARLEEVLQAFLLLPVKKPQHAVDALWAFGLLGQQPSEGTLNVLLARLAADAINLQPGQLSAIVWSLQRMGAEHLCPTELKRPLEASKLPFSVHQRLLPASWSNVESIMQEVEFRRDEIRLGEGGVEKVLEESRLTAWQSCTGMSFSYSGKTMAPQPMTPTVTKLREALAEHTGQLYDGVLINLYMTPSVGMRFHQDPGQGEEWTEETAVVSVGETRQFVMRRVDDHADRHVFYVSSGDCVRMFGACQRDWQHCVKVEGGAAAAGGGPRVSFVFKQSMAHAGGLSQPEP